MNEETTTEATEAPQPDEAKGLRKQLNAAHAELAEYKERDKKEAFEGVGLDPNTGLGKAIFKEYNGELTAEAVADYAKTEYGHEVVPQENPLEPAISVAQERLDNVTAATVPIEPPTQEGAIAQAEQAGDYRTSMALKAQQLEQLKK